MKETWYIEDGDSLDFDFKTRKSQIWVSPSQGTIKIISAHDEAIDEQLKFAIEVLDTFGNNCRSENDDWSDYVSDDQIKAWLLEREEK